MDNELGCEMDIHTACSLGDEELLKELIEMRSNVNVDGKNSSGWTPLMYATWGGHLTVAKLLIQAGASKEQCNSLGQTPLLLAVKSNSFPLVQLVFQPSILDHVDYSRKTALYHAVEFKYLDIARYLVREGANVNFSCHGTTLLSMAIANGHRPMVELLLCVGAHQLTPTIQPVEMFAMAMLPFSQGVTDLKDFLKSLALEKYWPLFQTQNIDLEKFLKMNESDLKSIGINLLGPRRKMHLAITTYNQQVHL